MSAGDIYHHTGRMLSLCCQSNGYTAKEEPAKGHCPHKRQWPLHCFDKICLIIRLYPISRHVFIAAGRHRHICQMRLCGVVVITYILRCTLKNRGYDPLSSVCESGSVMVWLQTRRLPAEWGEGASLFPSVKTIVSKVRAGPLAVKTQGKAGTYRTCAKPYQWDKVGKNCGIGMGSLVNCQITIRRFVPGAVGGSQYTPVPGPEASGRSRRL